MKDEYDFFKGKVNREPIVKSGDIVSQLKKEIEMHKNHIRNLETGKQCLEKKIVDLEAEVRWLKRLL